MHGQTDEDRQMDRRTERWMDGQTDRQTDRQSNITFIYLHLTIIQSQKLVSLLIFQVHDVKHRLHTLQWWYNRLYFKLKRVTIEQYTHVVLFIMLYKTVLTLKSVDKILECEHTNESYRAKLSWCTVYYVVQGGSKLQVCGWNPSVWPFKWKLLSSTFMWYCLLCCTR